MKRSNLFSAFLVFLLSASMIEAQEDTKVGLGVAIVDLQQLLEASTLETNATISIPIITSSGFRLEPEIGLFTTTQKAEYEGSSSEYTVTSWSIGLGLFSQKEYGDFNLYYGGRVGYMSKKVSMESSFSSGEETTSGFYIGPAIGGEHNFSKHFSLGVEAQFGYALLTNEEEDRPYDIDLSIFNTRALVFFRFYF